MNEQFAGLKWIKIKSKFTVVRSSVILHSTLQAIMKHSFCEAFPETVWKDTTVPLIFYHVKNRRFDAFLKAGSIFDVEFFLCGNEIEKAEKFKEHLILRMSNAENCKYYELAGIESPELRTYQMLLEENGNIPEEGELCLKFHVPVPFKTEKNHDNTFLKKETFIDLFERRMKRFFGDPVKYNGTNDLFNINTATWFYTKVCTHHNDDYYGQTIQGCAGQLYINGKFPGIVPLLVLGQELHAGFSLSSSQGYFSILKNQPFFDRFFPSEKDIFEEMETQAEHYDGGIEYITEGMPGFLDYKKASADLTKELEKMEYKPSPSQAFAIRKKHGDRVVEQLPFRENVAAKYVLTCVEKHFDKIFSDTSAGFRKGRSRNDVCQKITEAIKSGYEYVIESDIADFFPSVDIDILEKIAFKYIPESDVKLRYALSSIIRAPYILNGTKYERKKGLAQGSPLSPLLANIYLAEFDEFFNEKEIFIIRYADDFIILLKDPSVADQLIEDSKKYLSGIGLSIKMEKTAIKKISDGFSFLGFNFNESENTSQKNFHLEGTYRKPLYICKPFCFPSLYGESVNILKNRQVIESYPLRRVSEIIITEKSMVSTALISRCSEMKIPVSLSLGTPYRGTVLTPEGKQFYETTKYHEKAYSSLSENELLSIVRDITVSKITGYMTFFNERYLAGTAENIKKLERICKDIENAEDIDKIRGHEGYAAKTCYEIIRKFIKEESFKFKTRGRTEPDRTNGMLNYGYSLLFSRIHLTMKALGLNPYLGFLHSSQNRYESLVCDIQELFRARVDRAIIRMINLKIINESDFIQTPRGHYLSTEARKSFINNFEREMQIKPKRSNTSMQDEIYIQCSIIKQWALNGKDLVFYKWRGIHENR